MKQNPPRARADRTETVTAAIKATLDLNGHSSLPACRDNVTQQKDGSDSSDSIKGKHIVLSAQQRLFDVFELMSQDGNPDACVGIEQSLLAIDL